MSTCDSSPKAAWWRPWWWKHWCQRWCTQLTCTILSPSLFKRSLSQTSQRMQRVERTFALWVRDTYRGLGETKVKGNAKLAMQKAMQTGMWDCFNKTALSVGGPFVDRGSTGTNLSKTFLGFSSWPPWFLNLTDYIEGSMAMINLWERGGAQTGK